jgi:hypothetical protein
MSAYSSAIRSAVVKMLTGSLFRSAPELFAQPWGIPEIAALQPPLRLVKCACKQASIRLPPGLIPAQFCLRSTAQSLATVLACSIAAWHAGEKSLRRVFTHCAIAPLPGWYLPQWVWISAAHAFTAARVWAVATDPGSIKPMPIANATLNMFQLPLLIGAHRVLHANHSTRLPC